MEIIERIRHTPLVARNTTGRTEQRTHLRWGEKGATRRLGGALYPQTRQPDAACFHGPLKAAPRRPVHGFTSSGTVGRVGAAPV